MGKLYAFFLQDECRAVFLASKKPCLRSLFVGKFPFGKHIFFERKEEPFHRVFLAKFHNGLMSFVGLSAKLILLLSFVRRDHEIF